MKNPENTFTLALDFEKDHMRHFYFGKLVITAYLMSIVISDSIFYCYPYCYEIFLEKISYFSNIVGGVFNWS